MIRPTQIRMLSVFCFAVLALVSFALPAAADSAEAVPQVEHEVTLDDLLVPVDSCAETEAGAEVEDVAGAEQLASEPAAAGFCPHGAPSCWRDKQCDNYCGGRGYGACEVFCCACLG